MHFPKPSNGSTIKWQRITVAIDDTVQCQFCFTVLPSSRGIHNEMEIISCYWFYKLKRVRTLGAHCDASMHPLAPSGSFFFAYFTIQKVACFSTIEISALEPKRFDLMRFIRSWQLYNTLCLPKVSSPMWLFNHTTYGEKRKALSQSQSSIVWRQRTKSDDGRLLRLTSL